MRIAAHQSDVARAYRCRAGIWSSQGNLAVRCIGKGLIHRLEFRNFLLEPPISLRQMRDLLTRASRSYCQSMHTISVMSRSISASGCARRLTNRNVTGDKIGAKVLRPQSCSGGVRADHTRLALVAALPPYRDLLPAPPWRQTPKRCDVPGRRDANLQHEFVFFSQPCFAPGFDGCAVAHALDDVFFNHIAPGGIAPDPSGKAINLLLPCWRSFNPVNLLPLAHNGVRVGTGSHGRGSGRIRCYL